MMCISMTSGRMKLILCSLVVLVSTSKPQSMRSELLLVSDLRYDFGKLIDILAAPKPCQNQMVLVTLRYLEAQWAHQAHILQF